MVISLFWTEQIRLTIVLFRKSCKDDSLKTLWQLGFVRWSISILPSTAFRLSYSDVVAKFAQYWGITIELLDGLLTHMHYMMLCWVELVESLDDNIALRRNSYLLEFGWSTAPGPAFRDKASSVSSNSNFVLTSAKIRLFIWERLLIWARILEAKESTVVDWIEDGLERFGVEARLGSKFISMEDIKVKGSRSWGLKT